MEKDFITKLMGELAKLAKEENVKPIDIAAGAKVSLGTVYNFLKGDTVNIKIADWLSDNLDQDKVYDVYIKCLQSEDHFAEELKYFGGEE